ncbi:MAG TPA: hypothetical protein VGF56_10485 [Rhizomicrobium sp.]|jgi:hypothetical protein
MIARLALLLASLASLPAFASQALHRQAASRIVRIVVSDPGDPDHVAIRDPDIVESDSPDLGNRLSAWLFGGKNMTDQRMEMSVAGHDLDRALEARQVHLGADLRDDVAAAMKADGYQFQPEPSYDTDASVNLTLRRIRYNGLAYHGRISVEIIVDASMVDLNSHAVLFEKTYSLTDTDATEIGSKEIAPDQDYVFADYNAVVADPERAVAGLRANLSIIAKAIGRDLAR